MKIPSHLNLVEVMERSRGKKRICNEESKLRKNERDRAIQLYLTKFFPASPGRRQSSHRDSSNYFNIPVDCPGDLHGELTGYY